MNRPIAAPDLTQLRVLVVDDEADIRLGLTRLLATLGVQARQAGDAHEALAAFDESNWDLVLTDLMMPGMTGAELLAEIKKDFPETAVVLLTGFGTVQTAVQCVQNGASHFLTKPFDNQEILSIVRRLGCQLLARKAVTAESEFSGGPAMIAEDPAMRKVIELVDMVAPRPVPVLVEGESGSGKEVVARAVHERSQVSGKPFAAVNCAALSDTLLESELFGHVRGAFTGADKDRRGLFAEAGGGTIFLDEVSSMSAAFQGKLLRVLQEKVVRPVGASGDVPVDFRLIAATNRDLEVLVANGGFREDLFYRLAVVRVHIPALRDRPGDVLPLGMHFLKGCATECACAGEGLPEFAADTISVMQNHAWPGNVRELENAIQRAMIVCGGDRILPYHLGLAQSGWASAQSASEVQAEVAAYGDAKAAAVEAFQREFVERALTGSQGNVSQAATACGLTRAAFQKILKQLGIDRSDYSSD